ncbi:MAG: F0F1 ATP synthase subunit gamma [Candidatus Saccharimonadales bacterium]|jgi:ATP synthase F1 gamma subunit
MRQLNEISQERDATRTVVELTGAFEGIASMHISQIKNEVENSEKFFGELWKIYRQIRVDEMFHFGRSHLAVSVINKNLMLLITSEGSLSGDIDQKLIELALQNYNSQKNDIIVVGHHGTTQLAQAHVPVVKSFKLPAQDRNINVMPLVVEAQKYASTTVYYQTYISLTSQDVKKIELSAAVAERGRNIRGSGEIISEQTYLFEPSTYEVVDHLERSMMQITLSEVILESKLAQYASRFKAMTVARDKADESYDDLNTSYNRARRHQKDERLKEIINGLRKVTG